MDKNNGFPVYIGLDYREIVAYQVCKYSIERRSSIPVDIKPLDHRKLRQQGFFRRPWITNPETGYYKDGIDGRPFSTEFSHTRFLVPALQEHKGWALFMDCDMIFQEDINALLKQTNDKYAIMCVKHDHKPKNKTKMDGMEQASYYRKNWSSFVLFNCSHPSNKILTPEKVSFEPGSWLHAFRWLKDEEIGSIGVEWNWLEGSSDSSVTPCNIHYTNGGPWFEEARDVVYADRWIDEYEHWQKFGNLENHPFANPTIRYGG